MAPIFLPSDELIRLSQEALESYWEISGFPSPESRCAQHVNRLHEILGCNFSSGRWKRVIEKEQLQQSNLKATLRAYSLHVAASYEQQYPRVYPLELGECKAWEELRSWLEQSARNILRRRFGLLEIPLQFEADECAQCACEIIFQTRFPYDVAFDAWARYILLNAIRRRYRQPEVRYCELLTDIFAPNSDVDMQTSDGEGWEIPDPYQPAETWELRELLLDVISRLPTEAQREVIRLSYFSGLEDACIAERMGKSAQAIHNLRNRAHDNLRRVLENRLDLLR